MGAGIISDQNIAILIAIGVWVSAFGSIGASLVALYLAYRSYRVRLNVTVGVRTLSLDKTSSKGIVMSVANHGDGTAHINHAEWRIGRGKNRQDYIFSLSDNSPDKFPKIINPGDSAIFLWSMGGDAQKILKVIKKSSQISTLRVRVLTSVRHTGEVRVEKSLSNWLKENFNEDHIRKPTMGRSRPWSR